MGVAASSTRSCSKRTTCPLLVKGSTGTTGKEWPFLPNALISQGIYRQATFRAERAVVGFEPGTLVSMSLVEVLAQRECILSVAALGSRAER